MGVASALQLCALKCLSMDERHLVVGGETGLLALWPLEGIRRTLEVSRRTGSALAAQPHGCLWFVLMLGWRCRKCLSGVGPHALSLGGGHPLTSDRTPATDRMQESDEVPLPGEGDQADDEDGEGGTFPAWREVALEAGNTGVQPALARPPHHSPALSPDIGCLQVGWRYKPGCRPLRAPT